MHTSLNQLNSIKNKVKEIISKKQLQTDPKIIVVTKTFSLSKILTLIESGHEHFGENKLQEAEDKWSEIKNEYKKVQLHMIGKLQSNKAKRAVKLFDYIHSLDNEKLALKLSTYEKELSKKNKIFIQMNLAREEQKSGLLMSEMTDFYNYCAKELSLNIIGLMCLPPIDSNSQEYFSEIKKAADRLNLRDLSMGMSSDYEAAMLSGSTYLRLGTIILGERNIT